MPSFAPKRSAETREKISEISELSGNRFCAIRISLPYVCEDITVWNGIPYGADTSGDNRCTPPKNATPWNTTLQANKMGYSCGPGNPSITDGTVSEDCLNPNNGGSYRGNGTFPQWNVNSETDMVTLEVGDGFREVLLVAQIKSLLLPNTFPTKTLFR
ncbi:uncharacterized protein EAF01_003870 [Botrytis porri]|uniref:uncharacterized protein n=1 Tax=Botrytis porri TaxID=87229 RepID=UPI001900A380|nr:uncharacterized protein EAF01_003870 [Botrytis porri]KAF7908115.1 hypothetical protein EAF01_003870 [Botrytis porri]